MRLSNEHYKMLERATKEYKQGNGKIYIGFPIGYSGSHPLVYPLLRHGYLKELYEPDVWGGTWGENLIIITDKGLNALDKERQRQTEINKMMQGNGVP